MACLRISFAFALIVAQAHAQLAITEVMPVSRLNSATGFHGAEYWELTNFGTNDLNLHGYGFRDSNPNHVLRRYPFNDLVLRAGESVIFFRIEANDQSITNVEAFRAWWGPANVPTNLQCRSYDVSLGLSAWDGDSVLVFDPTDNLVDRVDFGRAHAGRSFTYAPDTGGFGTFSATGVNGAFAAALADDVGSPGTTTGPVLVRFLEQPKDQSIDGGMTATFSASAAGLPRPRYQWYAHGLVRPDANALSLVLTNVTSADAGGYHLVAANELSGATSVVAMLTVNTNPTPPNIISPPVDVTVFNSQTAVFNVRARGFPPPSYQWQTNGLNVPGATQPRLELANVWQDSSGTRCSVLVSNASGSVSASAVLTVTARPTLRFTEVMPTPNNWESNRHFGWFELTNYDTNTLDLQGWHFAEEYSLARAVTITNALTLHPGETVVFAERLDRERFARWWGDTRLPENFKLYTYSGFSLEYFGGAILLWNDAVRNLHYEMVAAVEWPSATLGVSYECESSCGPFGCVSEARFDSVFGLRGAFRAEDGADIGSPGYIAAPPVRILSITRSSDEEINVQCRAAANRAYRLLRATTPAALDWQALEPQTATNNTITFVDRPTSASHSFYRVEELP